VFAKDDDYRYSLETLQDRKPKLAARNFKKT
jgi:hypothetical protein